MCTVPCRIEFSNNLLLFDVHFRNLPEHERIVSLRGSVIDRAFGSSRCETAVLLIMDRYIKDLYVAIKCGLDTVSRYCSRQCFDRLSSCYADLNRKARRIELSVSCILCLDCGLPLM